MKLCSLQLLAILVAVFMLGTIACSSSTQGTSGSSSGDGDTDSDSDSDSDCDTDSDSDADTDADSDTDTDADTDSDADAVACNMRSSCYEADGCFSCAKDDACVVAVAACRADSECVLYEPCEDTCRTTMEGVVDWLRCRSDCKAQYPDGAVLYEDVLNCIFCEACTTGCFGAANSHNCNPTVPDTEEPIEPDTERAYWEEMVDTYTQAPANPPNGWLYTDHGDVKLSNGDGNLANDSTVMLRGASLIDISTVVAMDGGCVGQIDELASWGANIVRIPVYPYDQSQGDQPSDGGWTSSNATNHYNKYVAPCVNYATNTKGMYAIVDWHYILDGQSLTSSTSQHALTKTFWNFMAPKFAGNPKVLYEVFNEPVEVGPDSNDYWSVFRDLAQEYVDIVRTHAPDNLVLVGGPSWSQMIGGCDDLPILAYNVMYVGHLYAFHYTDGGATIAANQFKDCGDTFPVILTEWGYFPNEADEAAEIDNIKTLIQENNFHHTAWAFHDAWGPPMLTSTSSYSTNAFGNYVKNFLANPGY